LIRRHGAVLRLFLMAADAVTCLILFAVMSALVLGPDWRIDWVAATDTDPLVPALTYTIAWVGGAWILGLYRLRAHWTILGDLREVGRLGVIVAIGTAAVIWMLNGDEVSRSLMAGLFISQTVVTFATRVAIRQAFGWFRSRGFNARQILILGTGESAGAHEQSGDTSPLEPFSLR